MPPINHKISTEAAVNQHGILIDKLHYFTDVINNTVIYSGKYKLNDIISSSELDLVMSKLACISGNKF